MLTFYLNIPKEPPEYRKLTNWILCEIHICKARGLPLNTLEVLNMDRQKTNALFEKIIVQANLKDITGSVPAHCDTADTAIKLVT